MAVVEIKVGLKPEAVEAVQDYLAESEIQDLMVHEDRIDGTACIVGYCVSEEQARSEWQRVSGGLRAEWLVGTPSFRHMPDTDWKYSYRSHFKPWRFGRLHWVPIWERETYQVPVGEEVLWLDPGMAFGTGNHETTRLVVERLSAISNSGKDRRVIDAGCGSGILALSAVLLGFNNVAGFDNDPVAVDVSRDNARLNGLDRRVDFYVGDLVSGLNGRTGDIVLANIQADVLRQFSDHLLSSVNPGGALVLSGILAHELDALRHHFQTSVPNWSCDSRNLGEWSDLMLVRP